MTCAHDLFPEQATPSSSVLSDWLVQNGVYVSDGVEIRESPTGGWGVFATRDLNPDELILSVPKTVVVSARTTSLALPRDLVEARPQPTNELERSVQTNLTIPTLALVLLHEIRLGPEGRFWGYVQSLPRQVDGLPLFWDRNGDARRCLDGTEADRELKRKEEKHMGLKDLERFYETTKHLLRPTRLHPEISSLESYLYVYSLVSTRAFLIDLYHTLALVPFADILNHSSEHHTSLASDDFVCHICGSLATCPHDASTSNPTGTSVPERLQHLDQRSRSKIESEPDSVDMRIERPVTTGEEVMNTYDEGIGDSRLLVEWGFVSGDLSGEGICWDLSEIIDDDQDDLRATWADVISRGAVALELFPDNDMVDPEFEDDGPGAQLVGPTSTKDPNLLMVDQNGRLSLNIWIALVLVHLPAAKRSSPNLDDILITSYRTLEQLANDTIQSPPKRSSHVSKAIESVVRLLETRLEGLHRNEESVDQLLDIRDTLGDDDRDLRMAMTISIDERILLKSALAGWEEVVQKLGIQSSS